MKRTALIVVDFAAGAFALSCARSFLREAARAGLAREALELWVVENASGEEDEAALGALAQLGAQVLRPDENLGYARGVELAMRECRAERLVISNPDVHFLPGSLARLFATLDERPRAAAVGPRAFVDPARVFQHPPHTPATAWTALDEAMAATSRKHAESKRSGRLTSALAAWTAVEPRNLPMLSGACLVLERAALDDLGPVFDPRYPLYYEDTDFARRATRAGRELIFEPRAQIVHHWARSTGVGQDFERRAAEFHRVSRDLYFRRWSGWFGAACVRRIDRLQTWIVRQRNWTVNHSDGIPRFPKYKDLGGWERPPLLQFGGSEAFVVELALAPHFPLSVGVLGEGDRWHMDERAFEWLFPGRYFLRAHTQGELRLLGMWTFVKTTHERKEPLRLEETEAP